MMSSHTDYGFDHPIYRPADFYIDTPSIRKLEETITRWLWMGQTGGVVDGDARVGKTRAAEVLIKSLRSRTREIVPAYHVVIPNRDKKTIHAVLRKIALSLSISLKDRDTSDLISEKIVYFLSDKALEIKTRQVVLVVDEMQRLTVEQLSAFAELYDILRTVHVNIMIVFIGNAQEISTLVEDVENPGNEHIFGRFFTNSFHYSGLTSVDDVKFCLKQYDEIRYPPDNGPTITEFFMANAYKGGFRMESLSSLIWSVYKNNYQKSLRMGSWGMQYFTSSMNTLLIDYLPNNDIDEEAGLEDMIISSIESSGMVAGFVRSG